MMNNLKINVCIMLDDFIFCAWWVIVIIEIIIGIIWMMIWNHAYNNEFICFENVHVLIWKYNDVQMRLILTFVMILKNWCKGFFPSFWQWQKGRSLACTIQEESKNCTSQKRRNCYLEHHQEVLSCKSQDTQMQSCKICNFAHH